MNAFPALLSPPYSEQHQEDEGDNDGCYNQKYAGCASRVFAYPPLWHSPSAAQACRHSVKPAR